MKKVYCTTPQCNKRGELIEYTVSCMANGKKILYLAPSREVIFTVRENLINKYKGIINVSVIGFDELSQIIAAEKMKNYNLIQEEEMLIILSSCINKVKKQLKIFQSVTTKDGFIKNIYKVISDLSRNNYSPDKFEEKIKQILNNESITYEKSMDL